MAAAGKRDFEARWRILREEMQRNAYFLARRGSISAKWAFGGRRWVLRFTAPDSQGRFLHRSLYLGSDDAPGLLDRARELLRQYRHEAKALKEIHLSARLAAQAASIVLRPGRRRGSKRSKEPAAP